jgi:hypothetical protein
VLKAAIRNGDPTTTGGFFIAFSSTIHDDGRQVALHGDEATCGNCEGAHKIHGTGEGMSERNRCVVVDGDMVLCPCKRNRVVIGRNPGIFLEVSSGSGNPRSTRSSSFASSSSVASVFDEEYVLRDRASGKPLANVLYRFISDSGISVEGVTDAAGRTRRITTHAAARITVELEEAE